MSILNFLASAFATFTNYIGFYSCGSVSTCCVSGLLSRFLHSGIIYLAR